MNITANSILNSSQHLIEAYRSRKHLQLQINSLKLSKNMIVPLWMKTQFVTHLFQLISLIMSLIWICIISSNWKIYHMHHSTFTQICNKCPTTIKCFQVTNCFQGFDWESHTTVRSRTWFTFAGDLESSFFVWPSSQDICASSRTWLAVLVRS